MLGIVLGHGKTAVNKTGKVCPSGIYSCVADVVAK